MRAEAVRATAVVEEPRAGLALEAATARLDELREPVAAWRSEGLTGRRASLWDGERPLGAFQVEGFWGRRGIFVTAAGAWRIRTAGLLGNLLVEPEPPAKGELIYTVGFLGRGRVRRADGTELHWRWISLWRGIWAWCRRDEPEIRFHSRGLFRPSVDVTWGPEARRWPDLDALVGLGWWLLQESRRSAAH